jgi:thiosulfate dehydrogenase [quinone] large subunit
MRIAANILGYTTLRLAIGMSMFIHGVARMAHIPAFAETLTKQFSATVLPATSIVIFAWVTPPMELFIGLLVLIGLWTRLGLLLGGAWMVVLIFGSALIEQYNSVGIQLVYSLIFFHLLQNVPLNTLSVDRFIAAQNNLRPEQRPTVVP